VVVPESIPLLKEVSTISLMLTVLERVRLLSSISSSRVSPTSSVGKACLRKRKILKLKSPPPNLVLSAVVLLLELITLLLVFLLTFRPFPNGFN